MSRLNLWLVLVLTAVLGAGAACSGSEATSCVTTDDCFQGQYCSDDGFCADNAHPGNTGSGPTNQNGNGDPQDVVNGDEPDAQTGDEDTGNGDHDADSGSTEDLCVPDYNCDRLVHGDVTSTVGFILQPEDEEDEEIDRYGCSGPDSNSQFVGVDNRVIEAQTCFDDVHRYVIRTRSCMSIDFRIEVELKPTDDVCLLRELSDVLFEYPVAGGVSECEHSGDTNCFNEEERPEHGGYKWTVRFFNIDSTTATNTAHSRITIHIEDEGGFPYDLRLSVIEM